MQKGEDLVSLSGEPHKQLQKQPKSIDKPISKKGHPSGMRATGHPRYVETDAPKKPLTPEQVEKKREGEKRGIQEMIQRYCKGNHHKRARGTKLCESCQELCDYSHDRLTKCRRMAVKTFCSVCPTPCYRPDMQQRVMQVMRWNASRVIWRHPIRSLRHVWVMYKAKKKHKAAIEQVKSELKKGALGSAGTPSSEGALKPKGDFSSKAARRFEGDPATPRVARKASHKEEAHKQ